MTQETIEAIIALLRSNNEDDVKLGIICLLREADNQHEIYTFSQQFRLDRGKPINLPVFEYWHCKEKWLFINFNCIITSDRLQLPDTFKYNNEDDENQPIIHEVYDEDRDTHS